MIKFYLESLPESYKAAINHAFKVHKELGRKTKLTISIFRSLIKISQYVIAMIMKRCTLSMRRYTKEFLVILTGHTHKHV